MKQPLVRIMGMDGSGKTTICDNLEVLDPHVISFGNTPRYAYRWLKTYGIGKADEVTYDQVDIRRHVFMKMNEQEAHLHNSLAVERPVVAVRGRADTWISANALQEKPMPEDFDILFPKDLRPDLLVVLTADPKVIEERLDLRGESKTGANSMEYHERTQHMYTRLASIARKHMPVLEFDTGKLVTTPEQVTDDVLSAIHSLQPKDRHLPNITTFTSDLQKDIQRARKVALRYAYPRDKSTKVGCVLHAGGKIFTGANIARWSWNTTTCSERAALDKAFAAGVTSLERLVLYGYTEGNPEGGAFAPCGACRELLKEALFHLGQKDLPIFLVAPDGKTVTETSLARLLPHSGSLTQSQYWKTSA